MKTIKNYISTGVLSLVFLVGSSTFAQTETPETFTPFLIDINISSSKVELKCTTGCAWETLSFNVETGKSQWIDANGMALKEAPASTDKNLAPFKISMEKVGDKLILKSTSGAAWNEIPLNANAKFTMQVNEFGFIQ